MKKIFLLFVIGCILISCDDTVKRYTPVKIVGTTVVIDSTFDVNQNQDALKVLEKYKPGVQKMYDSIIGYNKNLLSKNPHDGSVCDFVADVIKVEAQRIFNMNIDLSLINKGGVRAALPKGDITVSDVYKVAPFDNLIVVLMMSGKDLKDMFNTFHQKHIPAFSGATVTLKKNADNVVLINGKQIVDNKTYAIATIDYMSDGGDHFIDKSKVTDQTLKMSDVFLRDAMVHYMLKNSPIDFKNDNRLK